MWLLQEVASFTALCEKYVGTESGGMDQAISIMGEKGKAKLVHFKPVRHSMCHLPVSAEGVKEECWGHMCIISDVILPFWLFSVWLAIS